MSTSYVPKKTDNEHFDTLRYSLYGALWLPLIKPLREKYKLQYSDFRILMAIDAFNQLFSWRLNGKGITYQYIKHLTGFEYRKIRYRVNKMIGLGYLTDTIRNKRHDIKLTLSGKAIVNLISGDTERVHERIIDYLYSKKILRH